MDPQTTWETMLDAVAENDFITAGEFARVLLGWLERGGFPPQPLTRVLSDHWDRRVCQFVCQQVLCQSCREGTS